MDGAHREGIIEEVAAEFDDAAVRAVADQKQTESHLLQPRLGDGQVKQDAIGVRVRECESGVERRLGLGSLLVDEVTADVVVVGELRDGSCAGQGLQGEVLALRERQQGRRGGSSGRAVAGIGVG
jgi:hypothetical protein